MNKLSSLIKNIFKLIFRSVEENEVNYICGGEALPLPLSYEEELEYLTKYKAGDIAAREKLIEHNLRLVVYISKRFENTGVDIEDLISVGSIGLIKAVNSFSPEKNIKLATFASRCIENEILMYLRKMVRVRSEVSIEEPLNVDSDGNMLILSDILGTDSDMVYKDLELSMEREMLLKIFLKLPPRERKIVDLRFGLTNDQEMTQKEIADMMGISQSYISRLEKKILSKIKKEMDKTT